MTTIFEPDPLTIGTNIHYAAADSSPIRGISQDSISYDDWQDFNLEGVLSRPENRQALAQAMAQPIRRSLDYQGFARQIVNVAPMPQGAPFFFDLELKLENMRTYDDYHDDNVVDDSYDVADTDWVMDE